MPLRCEVGGVLQAADVDADLGVDVDVGVQGQQQSGGSRSSTPQPQPTAPAPSLPAASGELHGQCTCPPQWGTAD